MRRYNNLQDVFKIRNVPTFSCKDPSTHLDLRLPVQCNPEILRLRSPAVQMNIGLSGYSFHFAFGKSRVDCSTWRSPTLAQIIALFLSVLQCQVYVKAEKQLMADSFQILSSCSFSHTSARNIL